MRAVLASQNKKKLRELQEILAKQGIEVLLQSELGLSLTVEETGTTFAENAALKARAVCEASGLVAISDDSGLVVDALGGAPGVYSARYGGEGLDDAGRYQLLLQEMAGKTQRTCRFVCVICCAFPNGDQILAQGTCEGLVAAAPQGSEGFGYDPIFYLPEKGKSMAELSAEEKHQLSHRGAALRVLQEKLETYLHGTHNETKSTASRPS